MSSPREEDARALTVRHEYIDVEGAQRLLASLERSIAKITPLLRDDVPKLNQTRWSLLASKYRDSAGAYYALGEPLAKVREALRSFIGASLKSFELKGTTSKFFTYIQLDENGELVKETVDNSADFSLTSSWEGAQVVLAAISIGEPLEAPVVQTLIDDPDGASYVGTHKYAACSPNEQKLAYSLREFVLGNLEEARKYFWACRAHPRREPLVVVYQDVLESLLWNTGKAAKALEALAVRFDKAARHHYRRNDPEYFLCIVGLGLLELLVAEGRLQRTDVTKSAFFPMGLQ